MNTFATTAPITVVLNVPAGHIQLIAADRTAVEISPADASKGRDVKAAENTAVHYADGVLRVENATGNHAFGSTGAVHVTVYLPAGSAVEGTAASAALQTSGPLGDVAFEGAYRQIQLDEVASLKLTATDGDVEVGRLNGPADISTAHGDIRVAEAAAGTVTLSTKSGSIDITAAPGVPASLDAQTSHGRISNALKNDGAPTLEIKATTPNGDITARSL
ncbi:DUF4097 family beta strand repeat-containing protein [Actinomadura rupiterrae]|uniref:DUF4097 family beta strand repeat-containing protein n=1 Tax=Actinomadura rupiterrae TaxID=559627 RepID=UPI0020A31432|nr:DUF4097 family beta strand repeat-containing protein [Actinomadura rupiterrae]MCP2335655.1 DUF4097 and DUF4098 domain-containing protein YvlB [Actinomadura rupiterrae]